MDNNDPSARRRKHRFIPKVQPRKKREPTAPTPDVGGGDDDGRETRRAQTLLSEYNERRRGAKVEKKSSVQVAFGPGAADASSTSIRTFGAAKDADSGKIGSFVLKGTDGEQSLSTFPSASIEAEMDVTMEDAIDAEPLENVKKNYRERWHYENSYYPTTLPLRQPNSGDPEILNENEFGEDAEKEYDESTINPASELGLLEEKGKAKLLFIQLPSILPLTSKPSATAKGKEKVGTSASLERSGAPKEECSLEELPAGCMGKMLVYKSGAIKLRLGDTLYDVSPGSDSVSAQDVVVANTAEKKCVVLGELRQRAVVTPDVDSLLNVISRD